MSTVKIEIDLEKVKEMLIAQSIDTTVRSYFEAKDIVWNSNSESYESYSKRAEETRNKRVSDIVEKVDWEKFPEEVKTGILKRFVNDFFKMKL